MSGELNLPPVLMQALDALSILPSNTEVKRNLDGKWVAKRVDQGVQPVQKLGPFGVKRAKVFLSFPSKSEPGMYRVDYRTKLSVLEDWVFPSGCHGPITEIPWCDEDKEKVGIPKEASRFCWCYPPAGMETLSLERKLTLEKYVKAMDPEFTFLAFGGFVYFAENDYGNLQVVRATALTHGGKGIAFESPVQWRKEFTSILFRQGRFQGVTIQSLKDLGLNQYCYINPLEELISESGDDTWIPCPHGGFVYLYNDNLEPHPLDRYFPQSPTFYEDSSASSSPTPSSPLSTSSGSIPFSMIVRGSPPPSSHVPPSPSLAMAANNTSNSNTPSSNSNNNNNIRKGDTSSQPTVAEQVDIMYDIRFRDLETPTNTNSNSNTRRNTIPAANPPSIPLDIPKLNISNPQAHNSSNAAPPHTCVICLEQPVSVLIIPCKHICVCTQCAKLLRDRCPLCRGDISEKWNVFL